MDEDDDDQKLVIVALRCPKYRERAKNISSVCRISRANPTYLYPEHEIYT